MNCKLSARAVQKYILRQIQDERLKVYVIWLPVFEKDSLEAAQESALSLPDPRVTHLWAGTAEAVEGIKSSLHLTHPPFDVFLVYPEGTKWGESMPAPAFLMHKLKDSPLPQDRMLNGIKLAEEIRELLR